MAQGPRHLRDSFTSTGLRKTAQTLTTAEQTQVASNLSLQALVSGAQISAILTTPVVDGVTYSASNARQIITEVFTLGGTALHAAVQTAVTFSAASVILRAMLDVTTVSTGASTISVGYATVSATTLSSTLLTGVSGASLALFDSMNAALASGANAKAQKAASAKWITVAEASGDVTGLVAKLYVQYILI